MMKNIAEIVTFHARNNPKNIAIKTENHCLSYSDLNAITEQIADKCLAQGALPGTRLIIAVKDEVTVLTTVLACARIGVCSCILRPSFPTPLRDAIVRELGATTIIVDNPTTKLAGLGRVEINHLDHIRPISVPVSDKGLEAVAVLPFTVSLGSGSTGRPKKIEISHLHELQRIQLRKELFSLTEKDIVSNLSPTHFLSVRRLYFSAFLAGAQVRILEKKHKDPWAEIESSNITVLHAPVISLFHAIKSRKSNISNLPSLSGLRILSTGGATVSNSLRNDVRQRLTPNLYIVYAANEYGFITLATPDQVKSTPGTVGTPIPGTRVEIVDDLDRRRPTNQVGHIRIQGTQLISGYSDDIENTQKHFRDGWFYPGDLGSMTDDGQIIFRGRSDDMMICNGINIFPAEIENVVSELPGVLDCAVIPFPHEIHQDVPICGVVLSSCLMADSESLLQATRLRLGPSSPYRIIIVDKIPRNETGKVLREEFRNILKEALHKRTVVSNQGGSPRDVLKPTPGRSINGAAAPLRLIVASTEPPKNLDATRLKIWLRLIKNVPEDTKDQVTAQDISDSNPSDAWIDFLLQLTHLGFEAARIPVLNQPHLRRLDSIEVTNEGEHWRLIVEVEHVDEVPRAAYDRIFRSAERLGHWAHTTPPDETSIQTFFDHLVEEFEKPYRGLAAAGDSTLPLLRQADRAGIPFLHLGRGLYQLGWGRRGVWLDRSATEADSAVGRKVSNRKDLTASLLRRAGLPAPVHHLVASLPAALEAGQRLGWPVVVKPADSERGEGVGVDITDGDSLEKAFAPALTASPSRRVLVEKQVDGTCHRLFIVDGRLLYAVKRMPLSLVGDGKRSVTELLDIAVREDQRLPPWHREGYVPLDNLAREALVVNGLTPDSVPSTGFQVPLRRMESTAWGGTDEDVSDRVHPDNLEVAVAAARLFRLTVAGIDLITRDIATPWHVNGAVINEVNFSPLLGGGAISRRHIAEYLSRTVDGDGRIPIEVYAGGPSAWTEALERQTQLRRQGESCWVVGTERTVNPDGSDAHGVRSGLRSRTISVLLDRRADRLLLIIDSDQVLLEGWPVDRVDRVTVVDSLWTATDGQPLPSHRSRQLLSALGAWTTVAGRTAVSSEPPTVHR